MVYDAVKMLELSQRLTEKFGDVRVVVAVHRLCGEVGFSPKVIREIFEIGIEMGRDALIADLYKKGEGKIGLRQLGDCFKLSYEEIRLILIDEGVERRPLGAPSKWKPIFESLTEEWVLQVMRRVATEPRFWSRTYPKTALVLQELGFPKFEATLNSTIWQALVERFKLETRKVGIVIKYREGEDPYEYLRIRYHQRHLREKEIVGELNLGQRVKVTQTAISNYMRDIGFPTPGKGGRDERW